MGAVVEISENKTCQNHNAAVVSLGWSMVVLCRVLSLTVIDTKFFAEENSQAVMGYSDDKVIFVADLYYEWQNVLKAKFPEDLNIYIKSIVKWTGLSKSSFFLKQ